MQSLIHYSVWTVHKIVYIAEYLLRAGLLFHVYELSDCKYNIISPGTVDERFSKGVLYFGAEY